MNKRSVHTLISSDNGSLETQSTNSLVNVLVNMYEYAFPVYEPAVEEVEEEGVEAVVARDCLS